MVIHRKRRVTKNNVGDDDRVLTRARVDVRKTRGILAERIREMGGEEPAATSTSDHNRPQDEGVVEERGLVRPDYTNLSLSELRLQIKPFKIVGSGGMQKEELLQLCHLFCTEQTPESETGQRVVTRLRGRANRSQDVATELPEPEDLCNQSVDVNHGSRRGSSRRSSRSASPERGLIMDTEDEQVSGRRKRIKNRRPPNDDDAESDTGSGIRLDHFIPASRRLTDKSELGIIQERRSTVEFPSRERGTALPRPAPTVLHSKDKGKQRAVSESDYEPDEEEIGDASDEENIDEPDEDGIDEPDEDGIDEPDGDPMSQDDSSKEMYGNIDQILDGLDDMNLPDPNAYPSDDDSMSHHGESDRFKRLELAQKETNQNVAQIATAVREIAETVKKMQHDASSGSGRRGRGGTQAKNLLGSDFLRRIRTHIWTLMGVKNEGRVPPSASEHERSRWKRKIPKNFVNSSLNLEEAEQVDDERDPRFPYRGGPGGENSNPQVLLIMWKMMNSVGVKSFRPIWEERMGSPENKFLWQLATAIFLRLVKCGEYDDVTNDQAKPAVVHAALAKHARQRLQRSFREYNSLSRAELEARQKDGVRHSRLNVWKNRRCETAIALQGMWSLCPFIKAASSDDETDEDEEFSEEKQKRCRVLRLPWRSAALEDLLVRLDAYHKRKKEESPKGTRGAKPRIRIRDDEEDRKESRIPAPEGLPIDCYSPEWLSTLDPEEREELGIIEETKLTYFQRLASELGV
ncbi:uncharacterized protein MELLADRAFT_102105 [Melampsora larici-populina 98AG31]|uniref:Uncharacterized protein n=1 Tax=Melampsora larici-populina (strain 98AG31 / pathotype 3-4-7) TaxID=747676 RepID=F4R609_MELLP|nr:uncharacterized protein MELLADRAFT_102105 [Melampsora larici-populina 98AG31]EGG12164.1 hypothetical protein MELLADRAFT_102105 [Melampsora larici-populina 98AG31]